MANFGYESSQSFGVNWSKPFAEEPIKHVDRFETENFIDLEKLNLAEREEMIEFLVKNNISFHKDSDDSYIANVRIVEPSNTLSIIGSQDSTDSTRKTAIAKRRAELAGSTAMIGEKVYRRASRPPEEMNRVVDALDHSDTLFNYSCYPRLSALVTLKETLQPRRRTLSWIMRTVEDIYDARHAFQERNTAVLENNSSFGVDENNKRLSNVFPVFVVDYFSKQYGLRKLVDQTCWDLMYNIHGLRNSNVEVEIFARFVEEFYDPEELVFFLYARHVIQREIKVKFRQQWVEHGLDPNNRFVTSNKAAIRGEQVFLGLREVKIITKLIFGAETQEYYKEFLSQMEVELGKQKEKGKQGTIEVFKFLHKALQLYHQLKPGTEVQENEGDTSMENEIKNSETSENDTENIQEYLEMMQRDRIAIQEMEKSIEPNPIGTVETVTFAEEQRIVDVKSLPSFNESPIPSFTPQIEYNQGTLRRMNSPQMMTPTDCVYKELRASMDRNQQRYLRVLLRAADDLPPEIVSELEDEVRTQLSIKVDAIISSFTGAPSSPRKGGNFHVHSLQCDSIPTTCQYKELESIFRDTLLKCHDQGGLDESLRSDIDALCRKALQTPDLRQEIEPLVALLVTYATARLKR